ncbi:Tm-1-like ATP-binding domain-containing protein [Halovenus rubra]|uniref:Tm-1-like ATP-binding domain-containing protein n=2 Tax=Halovenus rubra TaxID=869890 RepID=A0ACC7DZS6_9EURY|nr:Tm-1-like ATP-binding domain-containing protein [Halovenus rubra]
MAIVLIGTLDTKAEEIAFARDVLEASGTAVHVVDTGILDEPGFEPDTTASEVATGADTSLGAVRNNADRGTAIEVMADGAATVATQLHEEGVLDGVLGLGGSGNTSIATTAMRALPVGVPKVMVSTMASGDTEPYVGATDIAMINSVVDVEGLNQLSRQVITNAAMAVVGMATADPAVEVDTGPTIGITMFGVTTPCVQAARTALEDEGYETIVFHATGTGGQAMESLVREGVIDGVLDVTTTELADELVGGVLSAGSARLDAAGEAAIPQVVSLGALDIVNFGPRESVPEEFENRQLHSHNPQVTLMRTTPVENKRLGKLIADKLNAATGPTTLAVPRGGLSLLDVPGESFHNPAADQALVRSLKEHLNDDVELIESETDINDEAFAQRLVKALMAAMRD